MNTLFRLALSGLLAVLVLTGAGGCEETGAMRKARITRENAFDRDVHMVASLEDRRSEKLGETMRVMRRQYQRDLANTGKNGEILHKIPAGQVKNWTDREDAYRRAIDHHLEGDLPTIEQTVPHLIY